VRSARITVAPFRGLEVTVRPGTSGAEVERLLRRHHDWIERRLERARRIEAEGLGLQRQGVIWLEGTAYPCPEHGPVLERRYRREARRLLGERVASWAQAMDVAPQRLAIRDTRSRWGSCSSRGSLSFSWRLVMAPAEVADYVVVHELCHLRRADHSPAFWALVREALPEWKRPHAWLRRHGHELLAYTP
jgi:predicted metal-dependent hydrolase